MESHRVIDTDPDSDMDSLLDLSFLTEEEQNTIAEVLRRDSQLRSLEEGRISKLRQSVSDPSWLKIFSGDWFCDVRSKRHNHFGSDLVRASIRRKKKPKAGEWGPKKQGSMGDLEPIREPSAEEEKENTFNMQDTVDRLPSSEGTPPVSQSKDPQDAIQSLEQVAETLPAERSDSFSSLSSETEEEEGEGRQQTNPSPGILVSVQSNGNLENGKADASGLSPPKTNMTNLQNKLLSTSSSISSLSSSTMSGSLMSVFSDNEGGSVDVRGCIQFSLYYDPKKKELHIQIIQCRDLAEARKQRTDPYVKTYLLPDKSNHSKRKTAVKKRSLDPIFNETLKYKIDKAELQGRILNLSVWHHDSLSRNLFLGEVETELQAWDWSNTGPQWFNLQPRTPVTPDSLASRGKLNLALKFISAGSEGGGLPPTGELHIWVKNAQNLIPFRGSAVDSFVQCYILPDDSKTSRQKTRTVKKSLSPVFNHTMVYDGFQAKDLAEACAEFTVWDQDTFSKQQLGGVRLSLATGKSYGLPVPWMDSTEEERYIWETVFKQPGQWVEAGLLLRTNLSHRT
ncbi:synaptotagmin-like protein 1 [Eublepharis macularius]|uniref:Synaptotagmin-like protein 1 n=1 Tax=Eublepharis macularius TaxID=481883 RepID=A0AA97LGU2_EUBMA|nr:synaptotagmin-like protein 1 [Eublepharis macularius]XP_054854807.1 synaptotagmin-like protein 1 [Eublepharis macularius]XP_054854808.1 synaptotagmin-like protein 1 [Eublepharis macularius]